MTTIGTAVLQIIPSLDGVSKAVDKQLGGVLDGKKFGAAFGKDLAAGVRASESDVKRAMDAYSKLYDKQKDALGKVAAEQAKLNDLQEKGITGGRLVAQKERVEKATRDEARALREARDAYKEYERAAESAANAGKDISGGLLDKFKGLAGSAKSGGTEAASGFVEGFGGPIAALGTKAGPIGLALAAAAALAAGAGALIGEQVLAGVEQRQQQANLAAKLGLSPEQVAPIADAAAKAYANNFGESVQDNMDAARAAFQSGLLNPDATEADVQAMVQQLQTVSSVMGEEIPGTARAAQQAIRTGLVQNATQAFDLFTRAQQSGLNVSEDFLDTITEYGTQFRKLGLDGPEAIGLINQAVKGGARDTDIAADAIKEFSIRAVDGSKTTVDGFTSIGLNADEMAAKFAAGGQSAHDAFGQVLAAVRNVKDPVEQSRIAVELFGTQAEDLGGALGRLDLSNAVTQLGQVDGAAQRAADTMGNTTASSVESARRSIETSASSMQQSLAAAFGPYLQEGASWITAHQDDISHAFNFMAGGATEFGAAVVAVSGSVLQGLGVIVGAIGDTAGFVLDGFEQIAKGAATVADAFGAHGLALDLRRSSAELGVMSDQFHGWGEGLTKFGSDVVNTGIKLHDFDTSMVGTQQSAQNAAAQIGHVQQAMAALPGGKQINIDAIVTFKDLSGLVISPDQLKTPTYIPAVPGETRRPVGGRAAGGAITGPGGPTSDIIPIWASNGEHMLTADDVAAMGGQAGVYAFRNALHRADGGAVGPDVQAAGSLVGTAYDQASRHDCSGMVALVIDRTLGIPGAGLMSTKNAADWLAARGFKPGIGGPGQISVGWYDHGPNPNDGHMAMTLSDGRHAEAGGSVGPFTIGGGAAGADSPQFDHHMYLPTVYGEGPAGSAAASSPFAGGSAVAAAIGAAPASGSATPSSGGGGSSLSGFPSSLSELSKWGLDDLGKGIGTTGSGSNLSKFGHAAGVAVSGQVSSLLDVFGVPDSPGWLKGISTLIGDIKIGGGGSAAPLAANPVESGFSPGNAENMHGTRAGQAPGPQIVYNITARDTEDAFIKAQRLEREKAASKLDRF